MTRKVIPMAAVLLLLIVCACAVDAMTLQTTADDQFVTVNTSSGLLRGKMDQEHLKTVVKFLGVPFARPPIGKLRFTAPLAPLKWAGVRDALQYGNACMQKNSGYSMGTRNKSEDCLYLNVYSTSVTSSLPVMVWVHGGGYTMGAGSMYDATSLATKDVVMVTINYRLDAFGFLSTEDDAMPGNYGMMDQIAALRWVQDNIAYFGGDPKRVTVSGQSAGASSVSLLVLSPLAKGLFQKAIIQSGGSLTPWAVSYPGNALSLKMIARLVGYSVQCHDIDNTTNLLSCLQGVDSETLMNAALGIQTALMTKSEQLIMLPRVETTYGFLPDSPLKLIREGKFNDVDSIRGVNGDEMGFLMNTAQNITTVVAEREIKDQLLQFNQLDQDKLLKYITSFFHLDASSSKPLERQTLDIIDYFTFVTPVIVENHEIVQKSANNNHFLYKFNYKPSYSRYPQWISAIHGEELARVFNVSQKQWAFLGPLDTEDIAVSNQMMSMWTNFAKTGDPTSTVTPGGAQWKPYTLSDAGYLQINTTSTMAQLIPQDSVNFYFRFMQSLDSSLNPGMQSVVVG